MTDYAVVFSPEAEEHLASIYRYIARAATPDVAARYVEDILTFCEELRTFPFRGASRDDIRVGLRTTTYRRRVVVAFAVDEAQVSIIGVFYGGRDYEALL